MSARPQVDAGGDEGGVIEVSPEETRKLLDEAARELFGISGDEFVRRWKAGKYKDEVENEKIWQVAFYLGGDFAPR